MNFILLAHHFQSISFVITDKYYFFSRDKDKNHTVSLSIKLLQLSFKPCNLYTLKAKTFPDTPSRNVSLADSKIYQLEHKVIYKDIKF